MRCCKRGSHMSELLNSAQLVVAWPDTGCSNNCSSRSTQTGQQVRAGKTSLPPPPLQGATAPHSGAAVAEQGTAGSAGRPSSAVSSALQQHKLGCWMMGPTRSAPAAAGAARSHCPPPARVRMLARCMKLLHGPQLHSSACMLLSAQHSCGVLLPLDLPCMPSLLHEAAAPSPLATAQVVLRPAHTS